MKNEPLTQQQVEKMIDALIMYLEAGWSFPFSKKQAGISDYTYEKIFKNNPRVKEAKLEYQKREPRGS